MANIQKRDDNRLSLGVGASATITRGDIVFINSSGYAEGASKTASLQCAGIAAHDVTGGTNDADEVVEVERNAAFLIKVTSADAPGITELFKDVYATSATTVGKTASSSGIGNGRTKVGIVVGLEGTTHAWIKIS